MYDLSFYILSLYSSDTRSLSMNGRVMAKSEHLQ